MQTWHRRPMECIFCVSRRSSYVVRPLQDTRRFSGNSLLRQTRFHRRNDDGNQGAGLSFLQRPNITFGSTKKRKSRNADESALRSKEEKPQVGRTFHRPQRTDRFADPRQLKDGLVKEIPKALKALEHFLRNEKKPVHNGRSEMEVLDPQGNLWKAYRSWISVLLKKASASEDSLSSNDGKTWARFTASFRRDKASIETELYFSFLDFALDPISTDELREKHNVNVDLRYPTEWYSGARTHQRVIHLHIGPTNSGKTYNALKRLQESKDGFYAGPLRLLAHEVYSRFRASGIPCDLITGDDVRLSEEDAKVYASTVEMVSTGRSVKVAVIDEIQMMADEERGWAWTRAFLGANAQEVHLCGEERMLPLIRELSASMGDILHVHRYKRLNPLRCMSRSLRGNLKMLQKGDCLVAFSVMHIHALKKTIELETGKRCAIVYGGLPPDTRAQQAELFNDPDNDYDYLVASDAIGMGLNLAIKRIIFNTVSKWDGTKSTPLSIAHIKQIAGRAGRYRTAHQAKQSGSSASSDQITEDVENVGLVTCLDEVDLPVIRRALLTEAPPVQKAGVIPPAEYLEEYSRYLPTPVPFEYLMRKVSQSATVHSRFFLCDLRDKLRLARVTDQVQGLTIEERVQLTAAPASPVEETQVKVVNALAKIIAIGRPVTVIDVQQIPLEILAEQPRPEREYLQQLEILHKCLILYLWLSYRFSTILHNQPMAVHAKEITEQKINWTLRAFSANPKIRQRLQKLQKEDKKLEETRVTGEPIALENKSEEIIDPDAEKINEIEQKRDDLGRHPHHLIEEETVDEHFAPPVEVISLDNDVNAAETAEFPVQAVEDVPSTSDGEHVEQHDPASVTSNSRSSAANSQLDDVPKAAAHGGN